MSTSIRSGPVPAGIDPAAVRAGATGDRRRRLAMRATAAITAGCLVVLAMMLANRHTTGEEIWGVLVAVSGAIVGGLSLAYLATSRRSRAARFGLIALWATVAFFGYGGYNDHRLPRPADTMSDQRDRPPLAPLIFTAWGIAGAVALQIGPRRTENEGD